MGEVYRARDTKLDRDVAIKVLPEEFATDEERLARFEREAKLLASLNHTNIASIHGFEDSEGVNALVLELVEGPTLAERIAEGPIPVEEAIAIAKQIAEALEAGHEAGVIHRDLKPANIKLKEDGTVKVLDYGLAKALEGEGDTSADSEVSQSPTLTRQGTQIGVILGTAAYMSPEQAKGKKVDKRADIWAFGVVLYEMLSGKRAFGGESVSDSLAAVLRSEPEWDELPADIDGALRSILRLCVTKDVKLRARDIGDVRLAMEGAFESETSTKASTSSGGGWRRFVTVAVASLAMGGALTATVLRLSAEAPAPALVTRLQLSRSPAVQWGNPTFSQLGISADGRTVAFVGQLSDENDGRILIRSLDAEEATPLPGTERGFDLAFSPDGTWIAYRTLSELFKVPVSGGRPISLGRLQTVFSSRGLSWGENDWIYYAQNIGSTAGGGLLRVRASGGEPERLMAAESGSVGWPHVVGDGRFVVFSFWAEGAASWDDAQIMLLDTRTGEQSVIVEAGGASPKITASGHLVFVQRGRVLGVPVDLDRMMPRGAPLEVLGNVQYEPSTGTAQWALADNGTLVYQSGTAPGTHLTWADSDGAVQAFPEKQVYYDPRVSPDGRWVAVEVLQDGDDIWVLDLRRGTQIKLSQGTNEDETPAWSTDGAWVAWSTSTDDARVIVQRRADGSGVEETLWSGQEHAHVSMYAPDGRSLLFEKQAAQTNTDIWLLSVDGSGTERLLVGSSFNEWNARLSPDGRWLAYSADESGVSQVYVQPFPALDKRFQISPSGGNESVWSKDSRQLFYRDSGAVWAVSVAPGESIEAGIPERLFEDPYTNKALTHTGYDVASDGRFLVMGRDSLRTEVMAVVQNWFTELERLVPTK